MTTSYLPPSTRRDDHRRVLLLVTPSSYRTAAFRSAAERLGIDIAEGIDLPGKLAEEWDVPLGLDFAKPEESLRSIIEFAAEEPVRAIVAVDDSGTVLAALASAALGLPHNAPAAAAATRDKLRMRELLTAAELPAPGFSRYLASDDPVQIAAEVAFSCVVKPTNLNGSRGVIRANNPSEFVAAFQRLQRIVQADGLPLERTTVLVEDYIPGTEVALEGLMIGGELHVLALFDKPDPLDGPFFEETIYVTPSRLPAATQRLIEESTSRGAAAIGLTEGPIHAELRINERGAWILEIAGRSIGGLCSTILEFGTSRTLEELILMHATGLEVESLSRVQRSVGVMMIPIPKRGILRDISGVDEACQVEGITGVEISARLNHLLLPLPEGSSYLGFIFARGETPDAVERSLREAHARLQFRITPDIPLLNLSLS